MPLPSFIIAGERRCGTTSLANFLAQHPELFVHPKRDSGWFIDDSVRKGVDADNANWDSDHSAESYSQWFVTVGATNQSAIGEKSADYLFWRPAHPRMAQIVPDAKLIITLRNPADRAWSHYWNEVAKSREPLDFSDAVAAEQERLIVSDRSRYNYSYLCRGDYAQSLRDLFKYFSPDQTKIITVESLWREPASTLRQICQFVGVDDDFSFTHTAEKHNKNWAVVPRSWAKKGAGKLASQVFAKTVALPVKLGISNRTRRRAAMMKLTSPFFLPARDLTMPSDIRDYLADHFGPHIAALESLLNRKFPEWRD